MPAFEVFEWDERKRESTLSKHGIDFRTAIGIFDGPVLTAPSHRDERRWVAVGTAAGVAIAVIYTTRNGRTRIITARRADRNEQRKYHAHVTRGGDPPEK